MNEPWIIGVLIAIALFVVSEVLRPRPGRENRKPKRNDAIHHRLRETPPRRIEGKTPIYQTVRTGLFRKEDVIVGYEEDA